MKPPTLTRCAGLAGALTLAHASMALAAGNGENTALRFGASTTSHAASSGGSTIVRTIVGLFIVIAVIYGISWVLRQAKGAKERPVGHGLSQLASLPLGGGRAVTLVRAGQEIVLLGVSEHGVTPIRTYNEDEAFALGLEPPEEALGAVPSTAGAVGRVTDTLRRLTVRS